MKMPETSWSRAQAESFLECIEADLSEIGVSAQIVGSVATRGQSANDLDLLLRPLTSMGFEEIVGAIDDKLRPRISVDATLTPLEAWGRPGSWFANLALGDGRIVEFYFSEEDFPVTPEVYG